MARMGRYRKTVSLSHDLYNAFYMLPIRAVSLYKMLPICAVHLPYAYIQVDMLAEETKILKADAVSKGIFKHTKKRSTEYIERNNQSPTSLSINFEIEHCEVRRLSVMGQSHTTRSNAVASLESFILFCSGAVQVLLIPFPLSLLAH